eukprot:g78124.t1
MKSKNLAVTQATQWVASTGADHPWLRKQTRKVHSHLPIFTKTRLQHLVPICLPAPGFIVTRLPSRNEPQSEIHPSKNMSVEVSLGLVRRLSAQSMQCPYFENAENFLFRHCFLFNFLLYFFRIALRSCRRRPTACRLKRPDSPRL